MGVSTYTVGARDTTRPKLGVSGLRTPWTLVLKAFFSSGVDCRDFYCNCCSACAETAVIFGHFNRSFLLTYLPVDWCPWTETPQAYV